MNGEQASETGTNQQSSSGRRWRARSLRPTCQAEPQPGTSSEGGGKQPKVAVESRAFKPGRAWPTGKQAGGRGGG